MAEGPDTDAAALRRLEQRLDRAAETTERLLADVADGLGDRSRPRGFGGRPSPPPAGWQQAAPDDDARRGGAELDLLLSVLAWLRDRVPPELQQRLAEAIRELLLALRALIDWYLERSERRRAEPTRVQDIPIL